MHISWTAAIGLLASLPAFALGFLLSKKYARIRNGVRLQRGRLALSADIALWLSWVVVATHFHQPMAAQVCLAFACAYFGMLAESLLSNRVGRTHLPD